MRLTVTPTPAPERLDDLDRSIRQLALLAESAPVGHRNYLTLEAIALDDELWRLQRRRTTGADNPTLMPMIENLEADVDRLRRTLDELAPQAIDRPPRVDAEPLAA